MVTGTRLCPAQGMAAPVTEGGLGFGAGWGGGEPEEKF